MNNKEKYIDELNAVTAPQELREKIQQLEKAEVKPKKRHTAQIVAAAAACLVFLIAAVPALKITQLKSASDKAENEMPGEEYLMEQIQEDYEKVYFDTSALNGGVKNYSKQKSQAPSATESSEEQTERKIIKNADVDIEVRSMESYLKAVRTSVGKYGGYISSESSENYSESRSSRLEVNISADKLENFIAEVETFGNVTQKNVSADDVTDSYVDTEAKIKSLQTELDTLLKILEKAENLDDVIKLQDRITEVRGELDSYKSQLKYMQNQIAYSQVKLTATEQSHAVKTDGSFGSKIKEKFTESLYAVGDFFSSFAVNFIGSLPIIAVIAAAAVIIIVIIKIRIKKKR